MTFLEHKTICAAIAVALGAAMTQAHGAETDGSGAILINQAAAAAGNVTPGDAPGFPVTINQPGKYKLTGNLKVPDANTTAIEVKAHDVSIDLRGFSVRGPTVCQLTHIRLCMPTGYGIGIDASSVANATIMNGAVVGMGHMGISTGTTGRVEKVHVRSNGSHGIYARDGSMVLYSSAINNGNSGMDGTLMLYNYAASNNGQGIGSSNGVAIGNVAHRNANWGLSFASSSGYAHNVSNWNTSGPIWINGSVKMGRISCDSSDG